DSDIELPIGFEQRGGDSSAERALHNRVDVADVEPITRGFCPINPYVEIRLPKHPKDTEVFHASDERHFAQDLFGNLLQYWKLAADHFDRIGSLNTGQTFFDVVLNVLRKVEADASKRLREFML